MVSETIPLHVTLSPVARNQAGPPVPQEQAASTITTTFTTKMTSSSGIEAYAAAMTLAASLWQKTKNALDAHRGDVR